MIVTDDTKLPVLAKVIYGCYAHEEGQLFGRNPAYELYTDEIVLILNLEKVPEAPGTRIRFVRQNGAFRCCVWRMNLNKHFELV